MPKVRASSGTIGTTNLPMSGSRSSFDSSRTNTIVVEAARPSVPLANSSKISGFAGAGSGVVLLLRIGSEPPSAFRRSLRYETSGLLSSGL